MRWLLLVAAALAEPQLHVVSYLNKLDRRLGFLQVSAEAQHLYVQLMGLGTRAYMPDGLGAKINALRRFVAGRNPQDLVICADAFDVLVMGNESEIVEKFLGLETAFNKSIMFNAEAACYPDIENICEATPAAPSSRWRFLNAGLFIGRAHAIERMLQEQVPEDINDQGWYQRYRRDHPDLVLLDQNCTLLCALYGLDDQTLQNGRVLVSPTQTLPPLVHFVSFGHWTLWKNGIATSPLHQTFQILDCPVF
ncbi:unnamed protein product [Effrenium voratum]|nr:unnamed protein product [Effrenium voratum]